MAATRRMEDVLRPYREFIGRPDARFYPKLSVKLYGKGVSLDDPVDGATVRMDRHQIAKAGQVILSEIWGKKGAVGIVPTEGEGALCTSHFFLFDVREEVIERRYLSFLLQAPLIAEQLGRAAQGTTGYAAVRPSDFMTVRIPLPLPADQRRIAAKLDAISKKLEGLKIELTGAAKECSALWRVVVRVRVNRSRAPVKQLGTVLKEIRGGGTPSKSDPRYWDGSIPWISPKDMKTHKVMKAQDCISEDATVETPAHLIEPGAVLVVVRGMILVHTVPVAVLGVPAAINQDMKALIPSRKVLPEYLSNVLWAKNSELLNLVEKSTHDTRKLETEKLLAFEIPVPTSLEDQRVIVSELDALFQRTQAVETLQKESAALVEMLFPALLREAFTLQGSSNSSLTS